METHYLCLRFHGDTVACHYWFHKGTWVTLCGWPYISAVERYVFDGGSRGNPGPGGSGAVIVATDAMGSLGHIVWVAAMSYQQADMTNNRAEYLGVVAGLQAAQRHGWQPLEVVGDSALILGQLRHYRPPRNLHLLKLYVQARVLADKLGVTRWWHHYRAHNKMADAAANVAMDTKASIQVFFPTTRPELHTIVEHLASDLHQWQIGLRGSDEERSLVVLE